MIAKKGQNNRSVKLIIATGIAAVLLIAITFAYLHSENSKYHGKMYPNIYLDDKHIGSLTKQQAYEPYMKTQDALSKTTIEIEHQDTKIATLSGKILRIRSDAKEVLDRAYLVGRSDNTSSSTIQKLSAILGWQEFHFTTQTIFDQAPLNELIAILEDQYNKPAKDALFQFENGRVVNFREEEEGTEVDSTKLITDINKAIHRLSDKPESKLIKLSTRAVEPNVTLAEANEHGIEELIATGTSDFSGSIPGRIHNITLSASKFNGIIIPKGGIISFNEIVGDISGLTGYQQSYIIKNGRTVLGDGGGVCQTSTTLFRAGLQAGLPIIERTAHAYRVSYYENDSDPGFDATIYSPSVDLKLKNNTPASILIQTEIIGNILHFRFYGKRDDRVVNISPVTVWDVASAPEPKYEVDPTLPAGVVKQVDWAAPGAKAKFTYQVSGSPEIEFQETFLSSYRPWQAVYLRGTQ